MKVKLDKVDVKVLDAALAKEKLGRLGTKQDRVGRLESYFEKTHAKRELLICEVCGGGSPKEHESCPFCGTGDEETTKEAKKKAPAEKPAEKPAEGGEPELKPLARKLAWGAALKKKAAAPDQAELAKLTVDDLDASVKRINELQKGAIRGTWELGVEIKANYDRELWKLRLSEKGEPAYTNVREFWRREFGYSHTYCYQLMQMGATFSREDVEQIGPTKLHLIMGAPEAAQSKLLEAARRGEHSVDQLKKVIERVKGKAGAAPKAAGKDGRISIAVIPGRKTIAMLARPSKPSDDPKPAKKVEDGPWFEHELSNAVKLRVVLSRNPAGELIAVIEFKRIE